MAFRTAARSRILPTAAIAALAACQPPGEPVAERGDREDTVAEVGAFLESYRGALDSRDTLALSDLYVDDGRFIWLEDGEVRYRSAADVARSLSALPDGMSLRTEYDETSVQPVGARGASASMRFLTTMGEGSSAFEFGGVISMTLERGPQGWRIVAGHTSTMSPEGP
jgi:ketosteroid isomerase-like protein